MKKIVLLIFLLLCANSYAGQIMQGSGGGGGGGSIGLLATKSGGCDATSPVDLSHTVDSSTDVLVVGIATFTGDENLPSCTWNTTENLNAIVHHAGADGTKQDVHILYLASPTVKTDTVSCTFSAGDPGEGAAIMAINLENVDTTGTPGTDAIYEAACDDDSSTCSLGAITSTSLVIAVGADYGSDLAWTTDGFTEQVDVDDCDTAGEDFGSLATKLNDNSPEVDDDLEYETIGAAAFLEE